MARIIFWVSAGRDAGGGFGIETDQEAMKMGGAAKFGAGAQAVADFFGTFGRVGEAFEQGAQIETGSGGNDWKFFTKAQVVQNFEGAAAILSGGENFVRIEQIDRGGGRCPAARRAEFFRCRCRSGDRAAWNRRPGSRRSVFWRARGRARICQRRWDRELRLAARGRSSGKFPVAD